MTPDEEDEWGAFMAASDETESYPVAPFGDDDEDFLFDPEASATSQPVVQRSVAKSLAKCFSKATLTAESWVHEVHMVARAATVSGKFDTALAGYKMLAPSLGVKTEQQASASQHVHFHSADALAEQSTEALLERQEEIKRRRAQIHEVPPED